MVARDVRAERDLRVLGGDQNYRSACREVDAARDRATRRLAPRRTFLPCDNFVPELTSAGKTIAGLVLRGFAGLLSTDRGFDASQSEARILRRDLSAALSRKVATKCRRRAFAVQAGRLAERHDDGGWEGTGGIHDDGGRRLAFAIDASNVAAGKDPDAITRGVGQALGEIAAAAYGVAP